MLGPPHGALHEGTRYKIKENPGASFSITCSPDVQFSGTGSLGPPPAEGRGGGEIRYQANAQPLEVVLSGGIGPKDGKRYLIGQLVTATLAAGGLTPTSYRWSISDGNPFEFYVANDAKAEVLELNPPVGTFPAACCVFQERAALLAPKVRSTLARP